LSISGIFHFLKEIIFISVKLGMLEATLDRIIDRIEIIIEVPSEEPIKLLKCPTTKVPGLEEVPGLIGQHCRARSASHHHICKF
jgi:hypothetical protein